MRAQDLLYATVFGLACASPLLSRDSSATAACPASLGNGDLSPYAVVPVSKSNPQTGYGLTTAPYITPNDFCTWFAFSVPANLPNSLCILTFIFPNTSDLVSAGYNITGPGNFNITAQFYAQGDTDVSAATTWSTQPKGSAQAGSVLTYTNTLSNNTVTAISTGQCSRTGGTSNLFIRMCSQDTSFTFSESPSNCPLGLFLLMFPKTGTTSSGSTGGTT